MAKNLLSTYRYDPSKDAYYLNQNRVSDSQLRETVKKLSNESALQMRKVTQQLIAGVIILDTWYLRMQSLMYALYKTIWLLSIGGYLFDDDTQRNLFYLFVLLSYEKLDNFAYQMDHGTQPLDGRAMNRAGLYGRYGNGMWQNIIYEKMIRLGKTEAKNILGPTEDHCNDSADRPGCIEITKRGWIPIEQMVSVGDRTCYTNCLCHVMYR